jgi:hypothetical protein
MTQLSTTLDKVLNQYMLKVKVQLMNLLMFVGGTQMGRVGGGGRTLSNPPKKKRKGLNLF